MALSTAAFTRCLRWGSLVIFGMLGVVNFAHGACYMLGAYGAFVVLHSLGLPYW